jgi:hypothetical protein
MTYVIEIELAEVVGPDLKKLTSEIETAILRHRETVDIDDLLEISQAIAIVWDISHVLDQRPDLTDDQAWEVLIECQSSWDRLNDPMLETIRHVAGNLFPVRSGKAVLLKELEQIKKRIDALPDDELADPAAYGSVAVAIDDLQTAVEGDRS